MDLRKNIAHKTLFIMLGVVLPCFGIYSFFAGNNMTKLENYKLTATSTYGGDAYTGIQNAAADTSRNVVSLGNNIGTIMAFLGILLIVIGLILFIYGIMYPSNTQDSWQGNYVYDSSSSGNIDESRLETNSEYKEEKKSSKKAVSEEDDDD